MHFKNNCVVIKLLGMKKIIAPIALAIFLASCGPATASSSSSIVSVSSEEGTSLISSSESESSSVSESSKEISSTTSQSEESSSSEELSDSEESITSVSKEESTSEEEKDKPNPMEEEFIGEQFYLNHIGDIYSAWNYYRGKGITIAVIDGGFDPYHPDFFYEDGTSKVLDTSASFSYDGSKVTKTIGVDACKDLGNSHGSFCAGVAAAAINKKGVVGIAPDSSLLLLKVDLKPTSICEAFKYAADNGARVVTISIGSYYSYKNGDLVNDGSDLSKVFDDSVAYCRSKGCVVISAGGNGGLDGQPTEYTWPGASKGVIGVGGLAANSSGEIWSGSSYNSSPSYEFCDVFAPADDMFGCCHYDNKTYDGGWNGTSFASPQVAGMAALYFEKNPKATVDQFESDLYASCHPITSSQRVSSSNCGKGRVDVGRLLDCVSSSKINISVRSSWDSCYCYAWNLDTESELSSWPGKRMEKKNGLFTIEIDSSLYPDFLITKGSDGPQSVDLLASSFKSGNIYDLSSVDYSRPYLVGKYS